MTEATMAGVDIDSLLDGTLDDLADMPEFKPFPVGAHRCTIKWELVEINKQMCPQISLTAIETVELANPEDAPLEAGDSTNVIFMFKKKDGTANEMGQGQFKNVITPLSQHFGSATNRAAMEDSNGAECLVVTEIREDKKAGKSYTGITSIQVL